jgi:RNA polymerase sigma-70 factor (ECF subfamily)
VAIVTALRRLPEVQRRIVVLHYIGDVPVAEIVASTGIPAGTVKVYLARARAALAPLLATEGQEDADVSTPP